MARAGDLVEFVLSAASWAADQSRNPAMAASSAPGIETRGGSLYHEQFRVTP